jgi:hypothetical protein
MLWKIASLAAVAALVGFIYVETRPTATVSVEHPFCYFVDSNPATGKWEPDTAKTKVVKRGQTLTVRTECVDSAGRRSLPWWSSNSAPSRPKRDTSTSHRLK